MSALRTGMSINDNGERTKIKKQQRRAQATALILASFISTETSRFVEFLLPILQVSNLFTICEGGGGEHLIYCV